MEEITLKVPQEMTAADMFDYLAELVKPETTPNQAQARITLPAGYALVIGSHRKGGRKPKVQYRQLARVQVHTSQGDYVMHNLYWPNAGRKMFATIQGIETVSLVVTPKPKEKNHGQDHSRTADAGD